MSGSNPFDDLADDPDADDPDREAERDPESGESPTPDASASESSASASTDDANGEASDAGRDSLDGPTLTNSSPPFPYSDTEQQQMYVRDGLWDEFEDLGFDAELELRREFDVRNVEQRELDTAVVRLALERFSPREIAEMVVRTRGFDPSADE